MKIIREMIEIYYNKLEYKKITIPQVFKYSQTQRPSIEE